MIKDGFYKVHYSASIPSTGGVWTVENGVVRGADENYIFAGKITANDIDLIAEISILAFQNAVFPIGAGKYSLSLSGTVSRDSFHLIGKANVFGVRGISIRGDRLAPLML